MPYFPTYQETQDAVEHARLKMWHEHGKQIDLGGPEFIMYVMEGLAKGEQSDDGPTTTTFNGIFSGDATVADEQPVDGGVGTKDGSGLVEDMAGELGEDGDESSEDDEDLLPRRRTR